MDQDPTSNVKILILEGSPADAELAERALREGGLSYAVQRVGRRQEFERALEALAPDVILSDDKLADMTGLDALEIARRHDPDLPVIAVTGALGDEAANELIRAGAKDYVLKDRMVRLPLAVRRVLAERERARATKRTEEALRLSEEKFRNLVENSPEWIWELDAKGAFTYSSRRSVDFVGLAPEEVIGKRFFDLMASAEAARGGALFQDVVEHKTAFSLLEDSIIGPFGQEIMIEASGVPVLGADGSLKSIQGLVRDVTGAKRLERERELQAALISAVQETSPDAVLLVDQQARILSHNQRFAQLFDIPADLLASGDDEPVLRIVASRMADPDAFLVRVNELFRDTDATVRDALILKDGRTFDRYSAPVKLKGGAYAGRVWFFSDVTERVRAQKERDLQAALISAVQEMSPDGILVVDPKRRLISHNQRVMQIWGIPQQEIDIEDDERLINVAVSMMADPDGFLRRTNELYADTDRTGHDELILKNGRTIDRYSAPVKLKGGGYVGRAWFFRDVTEQKQAMDQLRDSEERFRAVSAAAQDAMIAVDDAGRISFWNAAATRVFGYAAEEAMGQDAHALLAPDRYLEDFRAAWPRFASDGEGAMVGKVAHLDGRRKGGGEFPIELSLSAVRLKGRWHGVAILRDITERVRVERQIREDEARFRGLVEQEIAGIYIIGADGKVAYLNPAFLRMLGYTSEEVIGRPLVDFVADEDKALVLGQFEAQIANETQQTEVGMALLRKDGDRVDVLSHSARAEHLGQPAVVGVLVDITKHRQDERSLKRLNRTLLTLSQANEALVRATSEPDLLQGMCRTLVEQGGYRMAWIGIPEHDEAKTVTPVAWAGEEVSYLEQAHVTWADDERGRGPTGLAIRTGIPQSSQRLAEDERMAPWREEALKRGFLSSASLPLKDGDEVFGALTLYSGEVDAFSDEELKPLEELANDLAYGMVALRVRADREATVRLWRTGLDQTISALASTTEKRDPYTAGHQNRVAQLAVAIARELKLPEDQVQGIRLAGTIHDVGKITIPSEILTKPGKLTPLEHQLIQTHAQAGYDMVKGVQFPWPIALAILQHHERLDGSGYPNGLKGDEIIREAKILAVADVVEAMMSHRPYRQALGLDAALDEVQKAKGRLYDPEAVDACVRVFRERGLTLT